MKLVVQSAMNTQLELKSVYKDQSIYHWYMVIFNLNRNLLRRKLQDVDRDRSFSRIIL